jgi:hypothetical protein
MRTVTYSTLKDRFASAIGVDTLLTEEENAFKRSLNDRVKGAWTRAKWPDLLNLEAMTVAAVSGLADKAVRIDNNDNLLDVYSVWDKIPWENDTASRIEHTLINGYLVLPADTSETTVYVLSSQVPADDYGTTTDLPAFLERHLLAASIADFYRADGMNEKAAVEEARAEEYILQELDRVERLQSQNSINMNQHQVPWPSNTIKSITI